MGCFKDADNRAIPSLEGTDATLDGHYRTRENAVGKCLRVAIKRGYSAFAVQDGGACFSSSTTRNTYSKYGPSTSCAANGKGGPMANEVYAIRGNPYAIIIQLIG